MQFVVDASVTLTWCFEDEATTWTDGLLDRLRNGDQIVVPAHWPTEISNGMLMALRRKRIQPDRPALFWDVTEKLEARVGIEPTHKGFADLSLTAWVPRHLEQF